MTSSYDFTWRTGSGTLAVLIIIYVVGRALYNVTLHPLARFPGPLSRTAFAFPGLWNTYNGDYVKDIWSVHQKYGEVVRIAPDALSFTSTRAWNGPFEDTSHHKLWIHLTGSVVRRQEGLVDRHIEILMQKLEELVGSKIDLNHWFNIFTFDVMSHLTFGESFGCLPSGKLHSFTVDFFGKVKLVPFIYVSREYALVNLLMKAMMMIPSFKREQEEFFEATKARVDKRMNQNLPGLHDFMKYILENNDEKGMSKEEIEGTTTVLLNAAGQETSTCLISTIFYLLKHPESLYKVRKGVLVDNTTYLDMAITEALRVHPPVSGNIQRRTGLTGHIIDGHHVPPNTSVGVNQYAACRSPLNFYKPEEFIAERWLPDRPKEFENDIKGAYQPFSVGPRNCIGKGLALMIANRTLTQLLKRFAIALSDESSKWDEGQKFNVGWDRPPMYVVLKRRV